MNRETGYPGRMCFLRETRRYAAGYAPSGENQFPPEPPFWPPAGSGSEVHTD